jgi:hypothetical protein
MMQMLPLARELRRRGHRVFLALRDLAQASSVFTAEVAREGPCPPLTLLQAPIKVRKPAEPFRPPFTFAHILHNTGFGDPRELSGLVAAWRGLFALVEPDESPLPNLREWQSVDPAFGTSRHSRQRGFRGRSAFTTGGVRGGPPDPRRAGAFQCFAGRVARRWPRAGLARVNRWGALDKWVITPWRGPPPAMDWVFIGPMGTPSIELARPADNDPFQVEKSDVRLPADHSRGRLCHTKTLTPTLSRRTGRGRQRGAVSRQHGSPSRRICHGPALGAIGSRDGP